MNQYLMVLVILLLGITAAAVGIVVARMRRTESNNARVLTRLLTESHTGMVVVSDAKGRILATSSPFNDRFGPGDGEDGGPEVVYDILEPDSQYAFRNIVRYTFQDGKSVRDFKVATSTRGEVCNLSLTVIPVLAPGGRHIGLISILDNPDRQTGLGTSFERLEKLTNVGQIAAGIAHELNTPLGSIILSADLIGESNPSPDVRVEAGKIKRQAERCSSVVKELLRYVKKDDGIKKPCRMSAIIAQVRSLVESELTARSIMLQVHIDTENDTIICDENQFEQLFFNLLSNSFHGIGSGGHIEITINEDDLLNQLVVEFEDDGKGIDTENLARIFDPFFTTKPGSEGTGLGLALCKRIVVEHDGKIEARSVPGEGATFILRFPVMP